MLYTFLLLTLSTVNTNYTAYMSTT